jgi:F-box/leucine-rich repeat protein 14
MRAVCSTWCSILDARLPLLLPWGSAVIMEGKLSWYQSVMEVDLTYCEAEAASGVLAELRSLPSLRNLKLPARCAESAVDAEAVCGLTTLTTLRLCAFDEHGVLVEAGEWVLDLSRLTTLNSLELFDCSAVTDKEVQALSNLTRLTSLSLLNSINVTSEGLLAVCSLTALTTLNLHGCNNMTAEGLRAMSSLTALATLDLRYCPNVTTEVLRALSNLTTLTALYLSYCRNVTSEGLQTLNSLAALRTLNLYNCPNVTAAAKQALRTAIPNLTIHG